MRFGMHLAVAGVVVLFSLVNSVITTCKNEGDLPLSADGYQYNLTEFPVREATYREWWFFTVYDDVQNIGFCMGYNVADPSGIHGDQSALTSGMLWTDVKGDGSNFINITDEFAIEEFKATSDNASVSIGSYNHIRVLNESTYSVVGSSASSGVSWDLQYTKKAIPCRQEEQIKPIIEIDWISYMPSAIVSGSISFQGRVVPVASSGYHDHNWGAWPESKFNWIWAQYNDEQQDLAMVMGAYPIPLSSLHIGYAFLRYGDLNLKIGSLCGDSFSFSPLKFSEWRSHKYSVSNKVKIEGTEWQLEIEYNMIATGPNPGGRGLNLLVFEQVF